MQVQPVCTKKKKNEPGGPKVLNNQTWQSNNNLNGNIELFGQKFFF